MKDLAEAIRDLLESRSGLSRQAEAAYAPIIDAIIQEQSTDISQIEHTPEGLFDFCFDPGALRLYNRLCCHYYSIDPTATADYMSVYRDVCDSEAEARS